MSTRTRHLRGPRAIFTLCGKPFTTRRLASFDGLPGKEASCAACLQARSRIAAAASDLFSALHETTDVLACIYRGEPVVGRVLDAVDSGRTALAKAEGRHG